MRKDRSSRRPAPWQHFPEPRLVVLPEISALWEMRLLRMTFGGESKCPFAHFPLLAYSFIHFFLPFQRLQYLIFCMPEAHLTLKWTNTPSWWTEKELLITWTLWTRLASYLLASNLIYFANAYAYLFGLHWKLAILSIRLNFYKLWKTCGSFYLLKHLQIVSWNPHSHVLKYYINN